MATAIARSAAVIGAAIGTAHTGAFVIMKVSEAIGGIRNAMMGAGEGLAYTSAKAGARKTIATAAVVGIVFTIVPGVIRIVEGIEAVGDAVVAGDAIAATQVALVRLPSPEVAGVLPAPAVIRVRLVPAETVVMMQMVVLLLLVIVMLAVIVFKGITHVAVVVVSVVIAIPVLVLPVSVVVSIVSFHSFLFRVVHCFLILTTAGPPGSGFEHPLSEKSPHTSTLAYLQNMLRPSLLVLQQS